ncbi:MAG: ABC transporter ATP-binding protein [Butyrivibrio sp.]|nr:ABC transporter ATP-binding protein [Muribaculum sp.]MCM1551813.1 ABC transporter ATP-binding protein [Butyrivibrio sp.]
MEEALSTNIIEVKNVTKDYGDFKLDNISFSVPEGSVCGFIGQNGAGKTTTIQIILDAINRDSGEVLLFGRSIDKDSAALRENIGVVFDEMGFHDFLTAKQINTIMKNIYKNWNEEKYFEYLKRFSLPTRKACGSFSRGMRMKLQIATALSHDARLLIMDEPTSGLDPIVRNEMLRIFHEYVMQADHTILLSSHITGDLEKLADEVVFIDGGKIILKGNKAQILEKHGILRCKRDELENIEKSLIVATDMVIAPSGGSSHQREAVTEVEAGAETEVKAGIKAGIRAEDKAEVGVEVETEIKVLVNDKTAIGEKYPELSIEPAGLEEIMIYYVNRAKGFRASEGWESL